MKRKFLKLYRLIYLIGGSPTWYKLTADPEEVLEVLQSWEKEQLANMDIEEEGPRIRTEAENVRAALAKGVECTYCCDFFELRIQMIRLPQPKEDEK